MIAVAADARLRAGWISAAAVFVVFAGIALWMDPVDVRRTNADPTAAPGFQSDEATYYLMGHSLARDFDLEYRHEDIERTRREFTSGPSGVFLKRGVTFSGQPDPDQSRLFYGKSFVYPLFAAPFVAVFGTKGFYILNSLLIALALLCAYVFISARSGAGVSLVLAAGFVFPTVVPVYWAWIAPELFNFSLGLPYRFVLIGREARRSTRADRACLSVGASGRILALVGRHFAGAKVFCLEERLINLTAVPRAAKEDFSALAPGGWLLESVPWTAAEHKIRAVAAGAATAAALAARPGTSCLVVERRTWRAEIPITHVRLTYPGNAHELIARFTPSQT